MKITLCMMLKNEGKTVKDAINSVLSIIDNAVIGIDETTTDNTNEEVVAVYKNISKDFPIAPISFKFENNFAETRNNLIKVCEQIGTDYVLILDGHEVMTENSIKYLQRFKEQGDMTAEVIDFTVCEKKQIGMTLFQQPRMFKPHIRYKFAIHNTIDHNENHITMPQVYINHIQPRERYDARKEQRNLINIEGLLKEIDYKKPRSLFYVAQTYYEMKEWQKAIDYWREYLAYEKSFYAERYQAYLYMSYCYAHLKQIEDYKDCLYNCMKEDALRNEHLVYLGDIYFNDEDFESALQYYRMAEAIKLPMRFLLVEQEFYTWLPIQKQLMAYLGMNHVDGAMSAIKRGRAIEPNLTVWDETEQKILERCHLSDSHRKGIIYFVASLDSFIMPIVKMFEAKGYAVRFENRFNPENVRDVDVIWCEWGDHNAIAISNFDGDAKKVLRVHSYEVYADFPNHIRYELFDRIIFVADHTRRYLEDRISRKLNGISEIIPNGVDLEKFIIPENKKQLLKDGMRDKAAWVGHLKTGKGVQVLLLIANEFPMIEFHVAGRFFEPDMEQLFYEQKGENLFFHGWINDINEFYKDKKYILSTSVRESNHLAVMEGMACGLRPLVYDWVGADEIYPESCIWSNFDELTNMLVDPVEVDFNIYRKIIEDRYGKDASFEKIYKLVNTLIEEKRQ